MAFQIIVTTVDGVVMRSCKLTGDDQETASVGVAEATVAAAAEGTTVVASPTGSPNPGPGRAGITYHSYGPLERCAVCGFVYPRRLMVRQSAERRNQWVDRDCYDELIPELTRRTLGVPRRYRGGGIL